MKLEWTAEIVRGWPADGALERIETVKAGTTVSNGDLVQPQVDGTVAKTGSTKTKRAGLVVRGNGDSWSAAGADGLILNGGPTTFPGTGLSAALQTAKTITSPSITGQTSTAGSPTTIQLTVTGHGWATGNAVSIAGVGTSGNGSVYSGVYAITVVDANTLTYVTNYSAALTSSTPTATYAGPSLSGIIQGGKAVVLWGNYIVRTTNFATAAYVPGSPVTVVSGQFALATGQGNVDGAYTVTATNTIDPEIGYVVRVIPATSTDAQALIIRVI